MMQVRSLLITASVSMAAGAAAVLMLPKQSDAYRMANHAAKAIKQEAGKMMENMRKD